MKRVRRHIPMLVSAALVGVIGVSGVSCKREQRAFRVPAPAAEASEAVEYQGMVRPGPTAGGTPSTYRPFNINAASAEPYGQLFPENAQALSDGQTLYFSFNCVGCHARGGGGMGPALLDNQWVYGADPHSVYTSIMEGRPNGMPSFRGRIPDSQIWSLVAYVRSKSGLANAQAAPGRGDQMKAEPPPNSTTNPAPRIVTPPKDQTER